MILAIKKIIEIRDNIGISQAGLARMSGVSAPLISMLINGKRKSCCRVSKEKFKKNLGIPKDDWEVDDGSQ